MDLMGQWAPSTFAANAKDGDKVLSDLGWFPFPTVDGGAGAATEQFGGGDGFAFGKDAPPEALDFAKFLVTSDVANKAGASGGILPVKNGAETSVTDPNMKSVLDARAQTRRSSSSTSTRRTRPPSARRSTTPCRSCSRARPLPRTWPARSRMRPRPDSTLTAGVLPASVRRARRTRARRRYTTIALFIAPALVLYLLLVIAPVVQAAYYSGFKWNGLGALDNFVGLDNFKRAFSDDVFTGALWHNFVFVVLSLLIQLPFALAVALMLQAKLKGRAMLRDPVLRAVRPVGGRHRRDLDADAAARWARGRRAAGAEGVAG